MKLEQSLGYVINRDALPEKFPTHLHDHDFWEALGRAVASEAFFEQPKRLASEHAALYAELSGFYRVDPSCW